MCQRSAVHLRGISGLLHRPFYRGNCDRWLVGSLSHVYHGDRADESQGTPGDFEIEVTVHPNVVQYQELRTV